MKRYSTMKDRKIPKLSKDKSVVDKKTGVMTELHGWQEVHSEVEFFTMYLRPWLGLKDNDVSRKVKVFVYCIMASNVSTGRTDEMDGNYFHTGVVIERYKRENKGATDNFVRVYLSKLVKDGFILKTSVRGRYLINPKFGIKGGAITQQTYMDLTVVKKPSEGVKPNEDFDKEGGEQ